jgi:hypothetical protein
MLDQRFQKREDFNFTRHTVYRVGISYLTLLASQTLYRIIGSGPV